MTATTHTPIEMLILANSACAAEDCEHEDECPTLVLVVCLECNAATQGSDDPADWEGPVTPCPIYGTGATPDQASALTAALTNSTQA